MRDFEHEPRTESILIKEGNVPILLLPFDFILKDFTITSAIPTKVKVELYDYKTETKGIRFKENNLKVDRVFIKRLNINGIKRIPIFIKIKSDKEVLVGLEYIKR